MTIATLFAFDPRAPLIGPFNAVQAGSMALGTLALWFLLKYLFSLVKSQTPGKFEERMKCTSCGWVGVVPRLRPACRKCGNTSLMHA